MAQKYQGSDRGSSINTPRWVKIFGVIILGLVLLAGVIMMAGGEHGPGRHMPSVSTPELSETSIHIPNTAHDEQQP
jgi:hypothetical protein